jgi:hypothetical protein
MFYLIISVSLQNLENSQEKEERASSEQPAADL